MRKTLWTALCALLFLPACDGQLPCPPFCGGDTGGYDCANPPELSGLVKADEPYGGKYIVVLKEKPTNALVKVDLVEFAKTLPLSHVKTLSSVNGFEASIAEQALPRVLKHPDVAYVQEVGRKSINLEWGTDRSDQRELPLDSSFTPLGTGKGVNIAIVDTGVTDHPDFGGRLQEECFTAHVFGGCMDGHGHGTHVAGTAAGSTFGLAREAKLWAVRVLNDQGSGSDADVIAGIEWVEQKARQNPAETWIINMSLGGGASPALDDAVCSALDAGVLSVVAAGNESEDTGTGSPSHVVQALTVGASDDSDAVAFFSDYGALVDLHAPGVNVRSAAPGGGTAVHDGTSMATPHVTGAAAIWAEHNGGSPADIHAGIVDSATPDVLSGLRGDTPNRLLYIGRVP
jgi:subtilisin family serine protease